MKQLFLLLIVLFCFSSCVKEDTFDDSPKGNAEALWRIIDEHYCFFDYKNIDWNKVHQQYVDNIPPHLSEHQLFEYLSNMLAKLKDGHINLITSFDYGRYWKWYENYPINFNNLLLKTYLGSNYQITAGIRYRIFDDNVGYVYCSSFDGNIGSGNLDAILYHLAPCNGLIIDIRGNGGGRITSAEQLASRFTNKKLLVGYIQHKTGKRHNDFSEMRPQYLKPSKGIRWQKRVFVLTNREVFSAANEFVKYMKCCQQVTIIGDHTGGGAGLPFSSELPNGWTVRFSACPIYDANRQSTEFGIDPDVKVDLKIEDLIRGKDTIIERARKMANQ